MRTAWAPGATRRLISARCSFIAWLLAAGSTRPAPTSRATAGARRGLLVKGGAALELIGAARTVAFDKTGTLTEGRPRVTDVVPGPGHEGEEVVRLAAGVEQGSSHPLAKAILVEAETRGLTIPLARDGAAIPGNAVVAVSDGRHVEVGSPRYAADRNVDLGDFRETLERLEREGKTVAVALVDGTLLGLIALRDEPRADAAAGIAALRAQGLKAVMLTGDNARTGAAIAASLGLGVKAELLPDDKLREIAALKAAGPVVMVGDGINGAPGPAAASVGVAMGGGTDVALETADAAVLKDRVTGVSELVRRAATAGWRPWGWA